jgi:pentatricopeptide repeat protein
VNSGLKRSIHSEGLIVWVMCAYCNMVMRPYIMKLILKLHINMVMRAYCKLEKLEKAVEAFREMKSMGFRPNTASYNTLIA